MEEFVSVAAPCRTCTGGHSKLAGRDGVADALASVPDLLDPNIDENVDDPEEHAPSNGPSMASAAIRLRRKTWNSDTPTPLLQTPANA